MGTVDISRFGFGLLVWLFFDWVVISPPFTSVVMMIFVKPLEGSPSPDFCGFVGLSALLPCVRALSLSERGRQLLGRGFL